MACNELCPVGIRPADLALSMRQIQEQLHPAGWKQTLFKGLIPHPGRMETATWPLRFYQRLGIRRLVYALGANRLLPAKLRDLEAMLPRSSAAPPASYLTRNNGGTRPIQIQGWFLPGMRTEFTLCRGECGNSARAGAQWLHRDHPQRNRVLRDASPRIRSARPGQIPSPA